jgi:hypothetical protein
MAPLSSLILTSAALSARLLIAAGLTRRAHDNSFFSVAGVAKRVSSSTLSSDSEPLAR